MIFITTRQLPFDVIQYTYNNYIESSKISFFGFRLSKSFQELHILFSITFSKPHVPAGKERCLNPFLMELRKRKTMERQFYCVGQILQQDDNGLNLLIV